MINVLLYCSYSGSAVGYQKAVVDEHANTVRSPKEKEIPKLVNQIWTHGGANAAAGYVNGTAYFLVKRIDYQNENKQRDEQGRKVYMNCAFISSSPQELQQFANGFFACYQAAVKKLGDLLIVDDTEIGYTIQDFIGLRKLISSCIEAEKHLKLSLIGSLTGEISFIALEGDWNYFATQNNISPAVRPKNTMDAKAYQRMLAESKDTFSIHESVQTHHSNKAPATKPEYPTAQAKTMNSDIKAEKELSVTMLSASIAPPVTKPDYTIPLREMEDRVTRAATKAATDVVQKKIEEQNLQMSQKVKRYDRLIKIALAVAVAAVVLTLILHNLGD